MAPGTATQGRVVAIRGAVVDIAFASGRLPAINEALIIEDPGHTPVLVEVQAHLDDSTARAIALQATTGLRRGTPVAVVGGPVAVPVGDAVLGRLLDVTGATGDRRGPLPGDVPRRPIHRAPPPFRAQGAASELFETGIKVIDLLTPHGAGRQGRDVRRRRRRQDRSGDGTDPRHGRRNTKASRSSPASVSGRARGMRC